MLLVFFSPFAPVQLFVFSRPPFPSFCPSALLAPCLAGGLAAGLVAFAGAKLTPGLDLVADTVALTDRLAGADLCITGEGMLDAQSLSGKTAVGVARLAAAAGVPVVCIPGQFAREAATDLFTASATTELFAAVAPLVADDISPEQAMREPAKLLRQRAAEAVAAFIE